MRRLLCLILFVASPLHAEAPRVATDIAPVHSLVAQVMQGVGEPDLVIPPGASPHGYAMRPSEARALGAADLVVWVGPALTPWLEEPLDSLAPHARRLSLMEGQGLTLLPFREGAAWEDAHDHGHDDHGHDDHAHEKHEHGHDHGHSETHHGYADPHLWLDPVNGAQALALIAGALADADPENADRYHANARAGQDRLAALTQELAATLEPVSGRPFIVFHDAFHYFEARFGIEARGAVSAGDAAEPGAARISELRAHLAKTEAKCAFSEPQMNVGVLETVIEGQGTRVAVLDPLGSSLPLGPDLYPDLLGALAATMVSCLQG
ncbi:zinc ABC transporter substrate-binding protein [Marimonas sp. MJW-29]|uniref:High-affinity zinc uptake system protein ZnuA n=1 Tax=Sulfitobacter sediminis TaxID=3234186 RepID=A0ABV3RK88_9RHOB